MCGGGNRDAQRRKAEREQKEADRLARERQNELDRISRERQAIAADQASSLVRMEQEAGVTLANNLATVKDLEQRQAARISTIRADAANEASRISGQASAEAASIRSAADARAAGIAAEAEKTVKATKLAGGAASASIRALGQKQPEANTAKQTRRGARAGGSRTTQAQVQRGSGSRGRGPNLSI